MKILERFGPGRSNLRASASLALIAAGLVCVTSRAHAAMAEGLSAYDAAVTADSTVPLAKLTNRVTFDGTAGAAFDFGTTSGDTTMEFIVAGDAVASGDDAFLAVGQNSTSSLRYEQYQNTQQMGFTRATVADYLFNPAVPSPLLPSHVTYVWNSTALSMNLYLDGVLAGTVTGVSDLFSMPTGAGLLGNNATGTEGMIGTIYRVTVYAGMLAEDKIKSHSDAFINARGPVVAVSLISFTATPEEIQSQGSAVLNWEVQNATAVFVNNVPVTGTNLTVSPAVTTTYTLLASNEVSKVTGTVKVLANPRLDLYDSTIAEDATGGLPPLASLTNTVSLTGTAGEPFDFGPTSGDTTMEFILEGDPVATGDSGFLAMGQNTGSSLRYEQYQNTHQMGFTQGGVADYMFVPAVPSPTIATHVAFVWNSMTYSLKVYVNGVASATVNSVSDQFALPTGAGFLGANAAGGELMFGRIFRVVVYAGVVPEATLQKHANAFTSLLRPPIITSFTATPSEIGGQGSATLQWQVQDARAVFLNGVDVTETTNQTVSPRVTTAYTLVASNSVTTVSAKVRVLVTPLLGNYDAAIAADKAGGLEPLATLTNIVTLTGSGLVPFDFGPTSGDTSMEFILEGDPTASAYAYLAVGQNTDSNLRYAQWSNTRQMGFTQLRVEDYLFTPAVASPTAPTHVVFVWDSTTFSLKLYTNGVLAATRPGVSDQFALPTGAGFLGSTSGGGEAMVGRIFRIVVYAGMLPEATIQKHGEAFAPAAPQPPSLSVAVTGSQAVITLQGVSGAHYQVDYRNSLSSSDTWQLLQDIPSLNGTSIQVTDPTATTGRSQRFYRAVLVR